MILLLLLVLFQSCVSISGNWEEEGFSLESVHKDGACSYRTYRHVESGLELIHIDTDEGYKSFMIAFRTPPEDDTGKPHVLEHLILSGSEKYPDSGLVLSLGQQSYTATLNAGTMPTNTSFYCASPSEEQLIVDVDVILAGIKSPLFLTEENVFRREAHRLTESGDILGVAYSEMAGRDTMARASMDDFKGDAFSGTVLSRNSGGVPDEIATLTRGDVAGYYSRYYRPDNALCIVSGDIDITRLMEELNSQFIDGFEYSDPVVVDYGTLPLGPWHKESTHPYPAEGGGDGKAILRKAYILGDMAPRDYTLLSNMSYFINDDSSALSLSFKEKFPGASVSASFDDNIFPCLVVTVTGIYEEDKEDALSLIGNSLSAIADESISLEDFDRIVNENRIDRILEGEDALHYVDVSSSLVKAWANWGGSEAYWDFFVSFKDLEDAVKDGTIQNLFKEKVIGSERTSVTLTVPSGEKFLEREERKAKAKEEFLSSLDDGGKAALAEECREFDEWVRKSSEVNLVESAIAVSPKSLKATLPKVKISDETDDGIRYLHSPVDDDLVCVSLIFDADSVSKEEYNSFVLLYDTLGEVGTENLTYENLKKEIENTFYSLSFMPIIYRMEGGGLKLVLPVTFSVCKENVEKAFGVVSSILFGTDFEDDGRILDVIKGDISMRDMRKMNAPFSWLSSKGLSLVDDASKLNDDIVGEGNYAFLSSLVESPEKLPMEAEKAKSMLSRLLSKKGLTVTAAGSKDAWKDVKECVKKLSGKLSDEAVEKAEREPFEVVMGKRIAYSSSFPMNYNVVVAPCDLPKGKMKVFSSIANSEYMLPVLREEGGAYAASFLCQEKHIALNSWMDPNAEKSFEAIMGLPGAMQDLDMAQSEIDGYILRSHLSSSYMGGPYARALQKISDKVTGRDTFKETEDALMEIKSFTSEDLKELSQEVGAALKSASFLSVSTKEEAESGFFETVKNYGTGI